MRTALVLLLLGFGGATAAPAADNFEGVDLRPLVRMHSTRFGLNTFPPPQIEWGDTDTFVSRGGATNFNRWNRFGERPFSTSVVRGVGKPGVLGPLRAALTANRVGTQKDCQIDTGSLFGFVEITWYGQGTRRNAFRASLGDGTLPGLSICPQEVETIISAIDAYSRQVLPAADIFDGVDLRPLVRMHSTRFGLNTFPPARIEWEDIDTFVSRGGATTFNRWARFGEVPFRSTLVRGVGKPPALGPLRAALTANRVGTLKDCQIDTGNVLLGFLEITWYGQGTRRNAFRATLGDGNVQGLPICPPEVETIISAIDTYDNNVRSDPDSEVHISN